MKTTPYWWEAAAPTDPATAQFPEKCDTAVVGAGFAGLSAALTLARAGRSVSVFDAMRLGEGASSRNGGIASGNIKAPFGQMIETFGLETALRIFAEGIAARNALNDFIHAERIDCDFKETGRFTAANHPRDYDRLGHEADLLNKHLGIGVEMVPRSQQHRELGTDFYHGGQIRPDIHGLHPALLHRGFVTRAEAAGAMVFSQTRVTGVTPERVGGFNLTTDRGTVRARDVIVATNGYTDASQSWLRRRIVPIPSQIIATEPLAKERLDELMPKRRMLGDTCNLYNYYRPSPDDTRIIFGGRRGAETDDPARKAGHLYENLTRIFPSLKGIGLTHSWWGYTGYTFDFLPKLACENGIHYATGFCGSGVVWAPWFGRKAALAVLGDPDADSVFREFPFETRPLYFGRPWFLPLVIGWYGLKDRFGYGRG